MYSTVPQHQICVNPDFPQDKSIKKFQISKIVESAAIKDIQEASVCDSKLHQLCVKVKVQESLCMM